MRIAVCDSAMQFQIDLSNAISDADSLINLFKTVKQSTCSLNGGIGDLSSAVENIDIRIQNEENRRNEVVSIQIKSNDFMSLTQRIDSNVATQVNKNKEELYKVNPWLRPPEPTTDDRSWAQKAWDWLYGKGETIVEETKKALSRAGDTLKKGWDGLVNFYENHKNLCKILLGVVAISIAVVVTVASGGAALPTILTMTKATLTAGLVSAAISGLISAVIMLASGDNTEQVLSEGLSASVNGFCSGFMWGGIFAAGAQIIAVRQAVSIQSSMSSSIKEGSTNSDIGNPVKVVGRGNTGRTVPNSLKEQMAMYQVQSNPLENASKLPFEMKDVRWPASEGWSKMQSTIENSDGTKTVIHFLYNELTGAFDDFKFK